MDDYHNLISDGQDNFSLLVMLYSSSQVFKNVKNCDLVSVHVTCITKVSLFGF